MSQLYLRIKADYNDADYVTNFCKISKEDLDELKPIIKIIQAQCHHNWPQLEGVSDLYKNKLTEDQIENFESVIPCNPEGDFIHTIKEIFVYEVISKEKLL